MLALFWDCLGVLSPQAVIKHTHTVMVLNLVDLHTLWKLLFAEQLTVALFWARTRRCQNVSDIISVAKLSIGYPENLVNLLKSQLYRVAI